jgi:hypothetical protein
MAPPGPIGKAAFRATKAAPIAKALTLTTAKDIVRVVIKFSIVVSPRDNAAAS